MMWYEYESDSDRYGDRVFVFVASLKNYELKRQLCVCNEQQAS